MLSYGHYYPPHPLKVSPEASYAIVHALCRQSYGLIAADCLQAHRYHHITGLNESITQVLTDMDKLSLLLTGKVCPLGEAFALTAKHMATLDYLEHFCCVAAACCCREYHLVLPSYIRDLPWLDGEVNP